MDSAAHKVSNPSYLILHCSAILAHVARAMCARTYEAAYYACNHPFAQLRSEILNYFFSGGAPPPQTLSRPGGLRESLYTFHQIQ